MHYEIVCVSIVVNLKDLELRSEEENLVAVLKSLPSQLHSLSLRFAPSKRQTDAIAIYCKRLRKFEMRFAQHAFEQFFAAVGPNLERLSVSRINGKFASTFFRYVKIWCPELSTLAFSHLDCSLHQAIAGLVVSTSTNLKYVTFPGLSLAQFQEIARHCPDVDSTVECDVEEAVDAIAGLASRLVSLTLRGGYAPTRPIDSLQSIASQCTRLREVILRDLSFYMFESSDVICPL